MQAAGGKEHEPRGAGGEPRDAMWGHLAQVRTPQQWGATEERVLSRGVARSDV